MERKAIVAVVLASAVRLASAEDALDVRSADTVVGDGRSFIPVVVSGGPKNAGKSLPVPDVATLACTNAAVLPAPANGLPAVLSPVSTQGMTLECKAMLRGADAPFSVKVTPPPAGLYAAAATTLKSTDARVALTVIEWDGKTASPPNALRAGASDGAIDISGGTLTLDVSGKVPRLVAVAMIDGTHAGAAFVPVIGVTTLPVESEPLSNVQVWIAGAWFGPVPTEGKIADVPIEVPPGITHAVARSTSAKGYITDAVTDLKIPARQRIGVIAASTKLGAAQKTLVAIAVAGPDGRPAPDSTKLVGTATRGILGPIQSKGGGLWTAEFTAPATPGSEKLLIRVDGDPSAGTAELALDIGGGAASRIELEAPSRPIAPGGELVVGVRVSDASGNVLDPTIAATATLDGAKVPITDGAVHARVPEHLPETGIMTVEVTAGAARQKLDVEPSAPAVSATITSEVDGRSAKLALVVRDRFGNLASQGTFDVVVTSGTVGELARTPRGFSTRIVAGAAADDAEVAVRAGGRALATSRVHFDPPAHAFVVGAWAASGWMDNLGALASPRAGLGLAIRRGGRIEVGLATGVEGLASSDATAIDEMGMPESTERTIAAVGVPVLARARARITRRFGLALAAGIVPMRVRVALTPTGQASNSDAATVIGVRAQLTGDLRVGPGRLFVGTSFGRAKLSSATAVGQLDGLGFVAGYEWWFGAFGG